jgi:predicted RNA-binding Zn-ribbon protein involved in translation (DUF1610 family)
MGQRKCAGCGALLYTTIPLDPERKDWAMTRDSPARGLRTDEGHLFLECPQCGRRLRFRSVGEHTIAPIDEP